jgi:glycosyltransferase involved in cell wall biosynthesis
MRDYLVERYRMDSVNHLIVVPGVADSRIFFFSPDIREEMRESLGLDQRNVYLYTGRLDKEWQQAPELFQLLKNIYEKDNTAFFMILTPNSDIAQSLFEENKISTSNYFAKYIDYNDLNAYLNAADFGILFRQDLPINHQASPTKFAEYVLTGLGILISMNVGDFSDFVSDNKIGFVMDNDSYSGDQIVAALATMKDRRPDICHLGIQHLSKASYIDSMVRSIVGTAIDSD